MLIAASVALVFALPLWWLLRERKRAVRFKADAERRHTRAAALLSAMELSGDATWSNKVVQLIREQLLEDAMGTQADPASKKSNARVSDRPPPSHRDGRGGGGMAPSAVR